ncbi:alpha/beta fold hydrolase [Pseudonocardia spinosispora]|uniref:alpha/beta fold hydrolase n=1 Tax=Pseudonocardia spinosispora TaxID=103441 RepID=UPI0004043F8A|nr:alpha/beta fold hydrolase [Pseudonocardia spinosispora]
MTTGRVVTAALLAVALAVLAGVLVSRSGADQVRTEELRLDVPAGPGESGTVSLDVSVYLPDRTPAPAVLVAHGFGGSKASVDADARELAEHGFVALSWSARGFGRSTGQISLDSPEHEVADASRLIDYLAHRPEVRLDGPNDPRVGVTGGSYGGALSLLLAAYDHRVDALAPAITWNDLGQALFPNSAANGAPPADTPAHRVFGADGVFKRGWAGIFFSAGLTPAPADAQDQTANTASGDGGGNDGSEQQNSSSSDTSGSTTSFLRTMPADPAGPLPGSTPPTSCGRFVPAVCQAYAQVAATGRIDPGTARLLLRSSPASVADRIVAPTLLIQGESDTLFGLDQADVTARQIASAGGTVSVIWYSGGHDGGAPGPAVRDRITAWFDRYLGTPPGVDLDTDDLPVVGGLDYAVQGGVRGGGRNTQTVRTVAADHYPGLPGAAPVQLAELPLHGDQQDVLNPAGANPAAITAIPGVGGTLGSLAGRLSALTSALPGQSATFATEPLAEQTVVAGASRVRIDVAPVPGQPATAEAVLFGKLLDVAPDGRATLLGSAVAPMRLTVPPTGTQATVTLPAVVAPVPAGHRIAVALSTTDQSYQGAAEQAVWRIGLARNTSGPPTLGVPLVPGTAATANTVPLGPAIGIGVILVLAASAGVVGQLRRRRRDVAEASDDPRPLVIDGLRKTYPGGVSAVNGVSFALERNQVLGLLGPNGAGKTTVLRMLMGLIHPSDGGITVFGHPVAPGAAVLSRIGSFVEGSGLLPHLSGAENLRLYWAATGRPAADSHLEEALEIAGLGGALDRAVRTYSQGMRQRLAIAQAMLGLPDLLVLDEPTNGLDPPQIHAMREVLRSYARDGRSVLVSSHLLAEVEQTCDHVVVMHRGQVVADGTVADLVSGAGQSSFRVDDPARAADVLRDLAGVSAIEVDDEAVYADLNGTARADVVGRLVRAGVAVESVGPRRRLEDAFLQLVGEDGPR